MNVFYVQHPIQMMEAEHEKAGQVMGEIRELTGNYTPPNDACTTYRLSFAALRAFECDLHQHVHLENNILFPRAIELFQRATASPELRSFPSLCSGTSKGGDLDSVTSQRLNGAIAINAYRHCSFQ